VLAGEPGIRDGFERRQERDDVLRRNHLERPPFALEPMAEVAKALPAPAIEREARECYAGLLAELERREPEVEVEGQPRRGHLVEDRPAVVSIAEVAEPPDQLRPLVLRADGVPQCHPTAALDPVHQKGAAAVGEEQRLVPEQGKVGCGIPASRDDGHRPLEVGRRRARRVGRRRAEQPRHRHDRGDADHAHRGAEKPRRVGPQREAPPEVGRILDVSVGEKPQPDGPEEDEDDSGHPARGEPLLDQRGFSVEVPAGGEERADQQREDGRLLVIESLEHGEDDPAPEQRDGEDVGGVEPQLEPAGEEEQPHAGEAAEEVRGLDDRERHEVLEPGETLALRGRRTGDQEDGAGAERGEGEQVRRKRRDAAAAEAGDSLDSCSPPGDLVHTEERDGDAERQEVVDGPVGEQRSQDCRRRKRVA
jgi:hypothetical protein